MTFNQDPNAPDFAAIYSSGTPNGVAVPDLNTELAEIGVTSLAGMDDIQLQDVANRLQAHRNQAVAQQAQAQQLAQANAQAQLQYLQASTQALEAQTLALTKPPETAPKMTPDAWLAYLQKVGAAGYGGDPADYANAVYDAHYQVATAGAAGEGTAPAAAATPATPGAATGSTRTGTGAVPDTTMAQLQHYLDELRAVRSPTPEQSSKLATYEARQILYQSQNAGIAAGTPAVAQPISPTSAAAPAAPAPTAPAVQPITQPAAPAEQPTAPVAYAPAVTAPPVQSDATLADWASRGWRGY